MTATLLDGRAVARKIEEEVAAAVGQLANAGAVVPSIAVVRVGGEMAAVRYAQQIERICRRVGFGYQVIELPNGTSQDRLEEELSSLSADPQVTGLLLQLPLPASFELDRAVAAIDPLKDIDGIHPLNAGWLLLGRGRFLAPATPEGGMEILRDYGIPIAGRDAVVIGRSGVVGRPLAMLLLQAHATVTICHSQTPDLGRHTRQAQIVAAAVGRPRFIRGDMIAPGAVVLDFGMNVVDGRLVGDVDFDSVSAVAGVITPVPGGTGPVTNAVLLRNALKAAEWQGGR